MRLLGPSGIGLASLAVLIIAQCPAWSRGLSETLPALLPGPIIDVSRPPFNACTDGSIDVQQAVRDAADSLIAHGGGTLWFPRGSYLIWTKGSMEPTPLLGTFHSLRGVAIAGEDAALTLDTTRSLRGFAGYLFCFSSCCDVFLDGLRLQGWHRQPISPDNGKTFLGAGFALFTGNCADIRIPQLSFRDMAQCLTFDRPETLLTEIKDIHIGVIDAAYCGYVIRCGRTGNNLKADLINSTQAYRTYYIDDVANHDVRIVSKNVMYTADVNLSVYTYPNSSHLHVLRNINIDYTNRETTANRVPMAHYIGLFWQGYKNVAGGYSSGSMEGIHLRLNIRYTNPGSARYAVLFQRYGALDVPDDKCRGRTLKDFTLTGSISGDQDLSLVRETGLPPACVWCSGYWGDTTYSGYKSGNRDRISGFRIHDLTLSGNTSILLYMSGFEDSPVIERVRSEKYCVFDNSLDRRISSPTVPVIYRECSALAFSLTPRDLMSHVYENCVIRDGISQSRKNTKFVNCTVLY